MDYDFSAPTPSGTCTVAITYNGNTTSLRVTIQSDSVTSISISSPPEKQSYLQGEAFDPTGLEVTLHYLSGKTESVTDWRLVRIEYDFTQPGQRDVLVYFGDLTASFTVTVRPRSLTHIAIHSPPEKTIYIVGEPLILDGLDVWAYFDNGESEPVFSYDVKGYDRNKAGAQTVTVSHEGKTASFTVTVLARTLNDFVIKTLPRKTTYMAGEALDVTGAVITVRYNDGTSEDIHVTAAMVSGYNANLTGSQTLTITYHGKTASFTVTVKSRVPDGITSGTYNIGGGFISKIGAGTTVSQMLNNINEKAYCKVYKGNAEAPENTPAGTGMEVRLLDGSTAKARVTVVVTGDTNGDGNITITDMLAVKSHLLKKTTLSGAAAKAADTSGDKAISLTDFIQIKAHILGKDKIQARAC